MAKAAVQKTTGAAKAKAPRHTPTPDSRRRVQEMARDGLSDAEVGAALGTTESIVAHLYAKWLRLGRAGGTALLAHRLFEMSVGRAAEYDSKGKLLHGPLPPDKTVLMFSVRSRMGWRDGVNSLEVSGPGGLPLGADLQLDKLSTEEKRAFLVLLEKAGARARGA